MAGRQPNSGPYIVTIRDALTGKSKDIEAHTWADACALMREALIQGYVVDGVRFA